MADQSVHTDYFTHVRKEILPLLQPRDRLLDVGCGEGRTAAWIKAKGLAKWVAGVELSPIAAGEAGKWLDEVRIANLETADIPFKDIDTILCLDVLEHLRNPEVVLKKLARSLKPSGHLIVSIPNVANFRVAIPLLFGRWRYKDFGILDRTHLRFFDRRSAVELLTCSGFSLEKIIATPGDVISATCNAMAFGRAPLFHFQYLIRASRDGCPKKSPRID